MVASAFSSGGSASVSSASARIPGALVEISVRFDGSGRVQVGPEGPVLSSDPGLFRYDLATLSRSADGRRFAYIDQESLYSGSSAPLSPGPPLRMTPTGLEVAPLGIVCTNPAFSVDGGMIAFTADFVSAGNAKAVYLVRRDGRTLRQLAYRGHDPSWSADGRWIAFTGGTHRVMTVRADGTDLHQIATGQAPVFAPAGGRIAFLTFRYPATLRVINRDGSGLRTIAHIGFHFCHNVVWSPDGTQLAWLGPTGLEVSSLAPGARPRLLAANTAHSAPLPLAFSPNGTRIAYVLNGNVYTVTTTGRQRRLVTSDPVSLFNDVLWTSETRLTYLTISHA